MVKRSNYNMEQTSCMSLVSLGTQEEEVRQGYLEGNPVSTKQNIKGKRILLLDMSANVM